MQGRAKASSCESLLLRLRLHHSHLWVIALLLQVAEPGRYTLLVELRQHLTTSFCTPSLCTADRIDPVTAQLGALADHLAQESAHNTFLASELNHQMMRDSDVILSLEEAPPHTSKTIRLVKNARTQGPLPYGHYHCWTWLDLKT